MSCTCNHPKTTALQDPMQFLKNTSEAFDGLHAGAVRLIQLAWPKLPHESHKAILAIIAKVNKQKRQKRN